MYFRITYLARELSIRTAGDGSLNAYVAIVIGSGYANEAIQTLLKTAEEGAYQLFVWHDADIDGYNIARTLREETEGIPGITLEILDLGLTVEEAIRIGCDSEPFERDIELPQRLRAKLSDLELEYFEERKMRFEINGIRPPSRRMAYVEELLRRHGVRPKYVPPADELPDLVREDYEQTIAMFVRDLIEDMLDVDGIVEEIAEEFEDDFDLGNAETLIRQKFEEDPMLSWATVVDREHRLIYREKREEIRERVREIVATKVNDSEEDGEAD